MTIHYSLFATVRVVCLAVISLALATASWGQSLPGSGNSLPFNGSSYVNCGTSNRTISTRVSAEAWIKTTSSTYQWIVGKYLDSNSEDKGFHLVISNGQAYFNGRIGAGATAYLSSGPSTTRIDDGRWHHLAGTSTGNVWRVYVDGVLESTGTYTYGTPNFATTTVLTLGNYAANNSQYFQGEIDEVRLWRTERTAAEIQQNMCRKFVTAPADLVAYYRLDQSSGLLAVDEGSQAAGSSALIGFAGNPWHTSGAPLGDASTALYQASWTGAQLSLASAAGDVALVNSIGATAQGAQLYAVNSPPSIAAGAGASSAYFGVFTAGSSAATPYSLQLQPVGGASCRGTQQRAGNDAAWSALAASTTTASTLTYNSLTYRGEYILLASGLPAPVAITGDSAVCVGATGQLTAAAGGASSYRWSTGATTATISGLVPGTYSVTATFGSGCTSTAQATIRQARVYQPVIAGDSVRLLCPGSTLALQVSAAGPVTYRWSTGATTAGITVSQAGTYTLTATSPAGCTRQARVRVQAAPSVGLTIAGTPGLCPGATNSLTANTTTAATVRWSTGATSATIAVNAPGTYSVTATSTAGCTQTASVVVTLLPTAPVAIAGDSAVCAGATGQLTATAAGATSYRWNTGATTATISGLAPGTYSVTSTFAGGCTTTAQATIRPARVYQPTISGDSILCPGATLTLRASAPGPVTYRWNTGATTASLNVAQAGTYTVTATSPAGCTRQASYRVLAAPIIGLTISGTPGLCPGTINYLTAITTTSSTYRWNTGATTATIAVGMPGTYSVTATSAAGCTQSASFVITLLPTAPVAISGDSALCVGSTGQLTAAALGATGYRWSTGATTATISGLPLGTYSVTATFGGGCISTAQTTLRPARVYQPTISGDSIVCAGTPGTLQVSAPGPVTYRWNTGATTASLAVAQAGTYTVTATSPAGCTRQASYRVRAGRVAPSFTLGADTTLCEGNALRLSGPVGTGLRYQWSDGSTGRQLTVSTAGTYSLRVSSECTTTQASRVVRARACLLVPNIITPNNDTRNDRLVVQGLLGNGWQLDVYDRWGRAVLHTDNYHNDWGEEAAPGIYYVLLQRASTGDRYKGWVEVVR